MPIQRLNHAVLFVREVARSVQFYRDVLGFAPIEGMAELRGAAFLRAPGSTNDHDLGLFEIGEQAGDSGAGRSTVGLYHLAWEVDTLVELERIAVALREAGALTGASDHSTTKALYARDPDGLEFEVSWMLPAGFIDEAALEERAHIKPLNIAREIERYGATTQGGVGVSR